MTVIGILSDSHGKVERTARAATLLADAGAQVLIHCGDIGSPDVIEACFVMPGYFVAGNVDVRTMDDLRRAATASDVVFFGWGGQLQLDQMTIAVTHGHNRQKVDELLAAGPDLLLTGHTHKAGEWVENGVQRINPGALHRASRFTVASFCTESRKTTFIEVPR